MSDVEDSASDSDDDDASAISDDEIQWLLEDHAAHPALPAIFQFEHPYLFGLYPASDTGSDILSILSDSMNWDFDDSSDTSELNSELQWLLTGQAAHHSDNEDGNMSDVSDAHNYSTRSQALGNHRQNTALLPSLYASQAARPMPPQFDFGAHQAQTQAWRGRMAEMDVNRERRRENMESNRRCFETWQVQFGEDLRIARDGAMEEDGGDGYDGDEDVDMMDVVEN